MSETSQELPVVNNGITPTGQPEPPVVEEFPSMVMPVTDEERREYPDHHMSTSADQPWRPEPEAVPGVGGIPGVSVEE